MGGLGSGPQKPKRAPAAGGPLGAAPAGLDTAPERDLWEEIRRAMPHLRESDRLLVAELVEMKSIHSRTKAELLLTFEGEGRSSIPPGTVLTTWQRQAEQILKMQIALGGAPDKRVREPPARKSPKRTAMARRLEKMGLGGGG